MARVLRIGNIVPKTWDDACQDFIHWKMAQGLSDTTINDYKKHIRQFFSRYPKAFDERYLKDGLLEYMSQPIKPATYNLRLVYLRAFLNWCVKEGIITSNPLVNFKRRKDPGRICTIEQETLQKLITLPNTKTYAGLRDYALIILTLDTGIRPKEAFSLKIEDVNFNSLTITVCPESAKIRVGRVLPILSKTARTIKKLIAARHPEWSDDVPVFCTCDGTFLNACTWGDRLEGYSKTLGVKIRPYDLRHAFALLYLRNGGHAFSLQKIMGHVTMSMTKRYVNLTDTDMQLQHDLASPLKSLIKRKHRVR